VLVASHGSLNAQKLRIAWLFALAVGFAPGVTPALGVAPALALGVALVLGVTPALALGAAMTASVKSRGGYALLQLLQLKIQVFHRYNLLSLNLMRKELIVFTDHQIDTIFLNSHYHQGSDQIEIFRKKACRPIGCWGIWNGERMENGLRFCLNILLRNPTASIGDLYHEKYNIAIFLTWM
jgi:hypothetical protein